jgi:hypothetical protein
MEAAGRSLGKETRLRSAWFIPAALFLFALGVRLAVVGLAHFDGLYGQDAFAYLDYTRQILVHDLSGPFYWPLGYPALAALFALGLRDPALGGLAASVTLGALLSPLVYELALEASGPHLGEGGAPAGKAALVAGLIVALSGQAIQSSVVVMADVTGLFWATLSAWLLLRFARTNKVICLLGAAIALALAIVTRWIFFGLALPWVVFTVLAGRSRPALARPPWQTYGAAAALVLLIVLPQVAFSQLSAAPVLSHSWVVDWSPLNAWRTSFDNPDGHFDYRLPPFLFYAEPAFHPFYLFPLLAPFIGLGVWRLRRSVEFILLAGWGLVLYAYLCGLPYENFRFGLAYLPPAVVFAAVGLFALPRRLSSWAAGRWRPPGGLPAWLSGAVLLASLPFVYRGLDNFLSIKTSELAAVRYLQMRLPPGSTVLTFGLTLSLSYYTDFQPVDLFKVPPGSLPALAGAASPLYVFVEKDNLETQWAGLAPQVNFHWFRDRPGLQLLGRESTWFLYVVKRDEGCHRHPGLLGS